MRVSYGIGTGLAALIIGLALAACEREQRQFRGPPPAAESAKSVSLRGLQLGSPLPPTRAKSPYDGNAFAIAEGQRLYTWFNCVGCHFHGGGGIGPPLMDEQWLYGGDPANIFASIVEGRANGMPSFGGKIPPAQVCQIVAYVRSLSGLVPKDVVPGRSDHMHVNKAAPAQGPGHPKEAGSPKPSERSP